MNIIADTNIFLAVALNEPEKDNIITLTNGAIAMAPEILPYEIGNAISAMIKRSQITKTVALNSLRITSQIPVNYLA
jgi:predicted nucleic acid-binding protein